MSIKFIPTISYVVKKGITEPKYSLVTWVNNNKIFGRKTNVPINGLLIKENK